MASYSRSNPLSLAVLVCLLERPMHPYEMATVMRHRGKEESIKLNYGSLYTVVKALTKAGLIEVRETEREGRRPERTIYGVTEAGHVELIDWLGEMLSTPAKEYPRFEGALSMIAALPPEDVSTLLEDRCARLEVQLIKQRSVVQLMAQQQIPELFSLETDYAISQLQAELEWVQRLREKIASGELGGLDGWRQFAPDRGESL
ncbi:MAG: PadR family transcriptional regulator [Candidatus Dormiibacterota bacterium]